MSLPVQTPTALPQASFEVYLEELRWLVGQPSPFTEPQRVALVLAGINSRLETYLPAYRRHIDEAGNLVCLPPDFTAGRPLVFLSAHVDTVPFQPSLWTARDS